MREEGALRFFSIGKKIYTVKRYKVFNNYRSIEFSDFYFIFCVHLLCHSISFYVEKMSLLYVENDVLIIYFLSCILLNYIIIVIARACI